MYIYSPRTPFLKSVARTPSPSVTIGRPGGVLH